MPVGVFLLLTTTGARDVIALTGSAAASVIVLGIGWLRTRTLNTLGVLVLLRFTLSLVLLGIPAEGKEIAQQQRLAAETGVPMYFCDPKSPWQRGTNENNNGLLRRYFRKRLANLSDYSQGDFDRVATELNDRPRTILGYRTPAEVLDAVSMS